MVIALFDLYSRGLYNNDDSESIFKDKLKGANVGKLRKSPNISAFKLGFLADNGNFNLDLFGLYM